MKGSIMKPLCMVLLSCVVLCSCELGFPASSTEQTQSLTANPCTAVALTTPGQAFTAQVGQPIALSASATCPAGQTPEFEYWTKAPTDSNWVTTAIGGYVPAGATFTPTVAGGLCFSVVTRAIGSTDTYQARSSGACGTVAPPVVPPTQPVTTVALPISGPGVPIPSTSSFTADFQIPIAVALGSHIVAVRVTALDNASGPTRFSVGLRESDAIGNSFIAGAGTASAGNGTMQTISSATGLDEVIVRGTNYACDAFIVSGGQQVAIHGCEVDIIPPI